MKSKMKLSGQLRSYLRWPLILSILMLVMNIGMYFVDVMAGMWFTLFFAVYVIAAAVLYYRQRPQVINELITFATEYGQVQKHLIQELALPYAVMDSQGKLLWVNKEFTKITGKDTQYHKCIATIFPELTVERLPKNEEETDINVAYGERYDKLATAIQSGDSPDLFPFEIRDFPYGVLKGRYQPIDKIIDLSTSKWDGARDVMDQFQLNGRYYCAIYEISFDSLLYYRKSVVEGAGLQDPRTLFENDEWTWDAFLEMAREFQKSGDNKYTIDGYNPENEFVVSTGTPIVSNVNGVITNNMYDANVERAMDLLSTLQKENLRYPRHELNGWSVNPKAWAQGDTLFYGNGGTWEFEGDSGLNRFAQRFGWSDDEICVVPYPRDPQADKYYHFMKQDALMWCKGSTNDAGVAAWIDCNVTASLDPATTAASIAQSKEKNGWSDYNLDFIYSQTTLDGTSKLTPIFDFKNGLGTDIASADTADSNVEQLTKYVYIQGEQSYTQLREANFAVIDARINEINEAIKNLT